MKIRYLSILALMGSFAFAIPALAQDNNAANTGTGVEQGARDLYSGTKAGVKDTAVTTKVKTALLSDKETKNYSIRVDTKENGIVELTGSVPSRDIADHAAQVTQNVSGVRMVQNHLTIQSGVSQ